MPYPDPNAPPLDYSLMPGQPMPPGLRPPMQPGMMPPGGMPPGGMPQQGPAMGPGGAPGGPPMATGAPAPGVAPMAPPGPGGVPGQLDPAMINAILEMQSQGPAQNAVARQRKLADQLRADASQGMEARQGYRPGLANLGASLFSSYKGAGAEKAAQAKEGEMAGQTKDAMRRYQDAYSKALGLGQ